MSIKKIFIFFFSTIVISLVENTVSAQDSFNRQQKNLLKEADIYYDFGDFHTALDIYQKLLTDFPDNKDISFRTAQCLFQIRGKEMLALPYFESLKPFNSEALFYLGRLYHLKEQFETSIKVLTLYKENKNKNHSDAEVDYYINHSKHALKLIAYPINVSIQNLGSNINSAYQDYIPLISADESILYFTSRRPGSTGNLKDPLDEFFEDIYVSKNANGLWQKPQNINPPINSNTHDATVSLSSNGNTLIFYRTNEDLVSGDLYITELTEGKWSEPVKLGPSVNSDFQEASACLSPDEQTLYFSSNREGGFGGKDLYSVSKLPLGDWSLPNNLGPAVNTPYNEDSPFMHIDGKTLYFSSKGHETMGGYDVFKTTKNNDNSWTEPQNIGYPINTVNDDIYFVLNASGSTGYYSTIKDRGFGKHDIYKINMLDYESGISIIKGTVKEVTSEKPLKSYITIIDEEFGDLQGVYISNGVTGSFIVTLEPGRNYQMVVESDGFEPLYFFFSFSEEKGYDEMIKSIFLNPKY